MVRAIVFDYVPRHDVLAWLCCRSSRRHSAHSVATAQPGTTTLPLCCMGRDSTGAGAAELQGKPWLGQPPSCRHMRHQFT